MTTPPAEKTAVSIGGGIDLDVYDQWQYDREKADYDG